MAVDKEKEETEEIINQYHSENRRCKRNKAIIITILEMVVDMASHHHRDKHRREILHPGTLETMKNLGHSPRVRNQVQLVVVRLDHKVAKVNRRLELAWVPMVRRRRLFLITCIQMDVVLMYN